MEAKLDWPLRMRPCFFFFFFCLFSIFTSFTPAISGTNAHYRPLAKNDSSPNDALIAKVCKPAPYYQLCVHVLTVGSRHRTMDEAGLVSVAIRSTISMAMQTSLYLGRLTKRNDNEPRYTTAYAECRIRYADVVGKLADWLNHVDIVSNHMAKRWVESAIDDIATCDKLFNQKSMVNVLKDGNKQLLQMCRNDVEILEHLSLAPTTP